MPAAGSLVDSAAYSTKKGILFTEYARAAFCEPENIVHWDCGDPCDNAPIDLEISPKPFGPGPLFQMKGFVAVLAKSSKLSAKTGNLCIVGFRGTQDNNNGNLLADALFLHTSWPSRKNDWCKGCSVDSGFAHAYEEVRGDFLQDVEDLNCSSAIVVGHSLGGAVASLASIDLRASRAVNVTGVWTFGKPRVGNHAYVTAYARAAEHYGVHPSMWRVVSTADAIPHLPPNDLGYCHEGTEVFYKDETTYQICPSNQRDLGENQTCMLSVATSLILTSGLDDHTSYFATRFPGPKFAFEGREFDEKCVRATDQLSVFNMWPFSAPVILGIALCMMWRYRSWVCSIGTSSNSESSERASPLLTLDQ